MNLNKLFHQRRHIQYKFHFLKIAFENFLSILSFECDIQLNQKGVKVSSYYQESIMPNSIIKIFSEVLINFYHNLIIKYFLFIDKPYFKFINT